MRLAAISEAKVIYSWTHDSVGVGEDGPTHQPIEHLASLRAMPGLRVVRPADANETATAWKDALAHQGPTALVLSRQDLPVLAETAGNKGRALGFVMTIFQKIAASSFAAVGATLRRRLLMLTIHEAVVCDERLDVGMR